MKAASSLILFILLSGAVASFGWLRFSEAKHLKLTLAEARNKWVHANLDKSKLQTGDIIFRHGRGFISNALMNFSRSERKYSHAGIISVENDRVYVYHAIGGEDNKSNKLRKDLLDAYCNPNDVHAFGIYRTDLSDKQKTKIDSLVHYYYQSGLEFDIDFDLATDDKMYCTEFVGKVLKGVSANLNYLPSSTVTGMRYLACDDIYLQPQFRNIFSYNYDDSKLLTHNPL